MNLPYIAFANWIRIPSSIWGTKWPNIRPVQTIELTYASREIKRAITGNSGTMSGNLFLFAWFVFNTSRNIRPCSVRLKYWKCTGSSTEIVTLYYCCIYWKCDMTISVDHPVFLWVNKGYIGTVCTNPKRNNSVNIRLKMDLKKVQNYSQIFEQNIHEAF